MTMSAAVPPTPAEERKRGEQAAKELASSGLYPAPATECDIVMKGGIASGVVYPLTICRLATKYQLRSIGGTSAGAIAAVLAAAAEFRRTQEPDSTSGGFVALAGLPENIATAIPGLFRPDPLAEPVFAVLDAQINPGGSALKRRIRPLWVLVRKRWIWFLVAAVATLAVAFSGGLIAAGLPDSDAEWLRLLVGLAPALVPAVLVGCVAAAVGLVRLALDVLPKRDFGLTNYSGEAGEGTALSKWLDENVQLVAFGHQPAGSTPPATVTLGHLWGAHGLARWREYVDGNEPGGGADEAEAKGSEVGGRGHAPIGVCRRARATDLEVMTTDLTNGRPYRLPFKDQTFMFDRCEFERLFPEPVVQTMCTRQSDRTNPETGDPLWFFPGQGRRLRAAEAEREGQGDRMPGPPELPLVVMARMSLSFPGLISGVPLYSVDWGGDQSVVRHLFSDGGVSSNFPMHFFDALIPTRPTFGINLAPPHPQHPESRVWRATSLNSGTFPRIRQLRTTMDFLGSLRDTMQNWSDNKQVTQRGYTDRVVEIRLDKSEGGINLRMPEDTIWRMVARGDDAGKELLTFDWKTHRRVRYRIAMARLTEALEGFRQAFDEAEYEEVLSSVRRGNPGAGYFGSTAWRADDAAATQGLLDVVSDWEANSWPALQHPRPSPAPSIRMAPE
jgi:hypothetical protein